MHNYLSNNRRLLGCIFITLILISFSFLHQKAYLKNKTWKSTEKIVKSHLMLCSFENEIEWAKYGKFKCNLKKGLTSL